MNIMMSGIDGRQATRMIRSNPETKVIPILVATVLFSELDLRDCIEAGCDNFIVKPFTVQELQRKFQEIIPASSPKIQ
jgi:CheY-like chemotaxis protein